MRPVHDLLRWIRRNVDGFYAALGAYLTFGLAVVLAGILLFAALASLMARGVTQRADEAVLLWMYSHHTPELARWAEKLTDLGSTTVVVMVVLVSSAFLWVTKHRHWVLLLWVSMLGGAVINTTLKAVFDRPRPELWDRGYAGHASFPSGHAMSAVIIYGTIAYLITRMGPTRAMRRLTIAVAVLVILLIGVTRLYLGVHYPSDVVAAYLAASAWIACCAIGVEAARYFRRGG